MDPSPLPEGQAELKRVLGEARIISGDAGNGLDGSERDALADLADAAETLLSELETARRNLHATCATVDAYEDAHEPLHDRLQRTEADLSRALEALGPFAEFEDAIDCTLPDDDQYNYEIGLNGGHALTAGDFRRASEVFTTLSKGGGNG